MICSFRKGAWRRTMLKVARGKAKLATVINDWAKILDNKGQVDTFILDFEKAFDTPHMNSLRVNCLVMELVVKR